MRLDIRLHHWSDTLFAMSDDPPRRGEAICAMRGSCGRATMFGEELPCPDHDNATEVSPCCLHSVECFADERSGKTSDKLRDLMGAVCGPAYEIPSTVCCTYDQVSTLSDRLKQAAPLIASCPACINNFRSFYCDFTCSPDQSTFLTISSTQQTTSGETAVKSVEYAVGEDFKQGFFDSCKNVQFGATNGFAMDLIGGGAKNASAFLQYMGDMRPGLGSPFQINFPEDPDTGYTRQPLSCADSSIDARCACADCPEVCPSLPYVAPPSTGKCHVGAVSCLTFSLLILYSVAILLGLLFYSWKQALRQRQRRYERVALLDPPLSPTNGGANGLDGMVGRGDDAESGPSGSIHFRLGRGASLLDPMDHLQPKQNKINATLRRFFYRLGLTCSRKPMETFAIAAVVIALLNVGWKNFQVETDPVRLWVAPNSESAQQKHYFDDTFGPFYRAEQVFVIMKDGSSPLNRDTLDWWLRAESEIGNLKSENGYSLDQVCFAPAGRGTPCVIQSVSAWLGENLDEWGDDWENRVSDCANRPGECLPPFGQPIEPKLVLGASNGDWLSAKALVITLVVENFNDARVLPAMEWERTLKAYLGGLAHEQVVVHYSTEISLQEELNKSTNTDVKIVVLSYLVMFLYVSLTLGGGLPPSLLTSVWRWIAHIPVLIGLTKASPEDPPPPRLSLASIPTFVSVNSKFSLGLFGIVIVLIAVSSSVGLFSLMNVRVTLIIAEVIPFLVLAVGVDNVFILVHELDRQNSLHVQPGPDLSLQDEDDDDEMPAHPNPTLPAEERVARAVARMGPSIALSSITETVAFALGALVPMPAVRNFAIYAAGSVFLGAVMQVTVFVSAMSMDLKRAEVRLFYLIMEVN